MNLIKLFEFSLQDIVIAKVMDTNTFRDRAHKIEAVTKDYKYKQNMQMTKTTLYADCKEGEEYAGKYFLQDVAYEWKKQNKNKNGHDLLLFTEETSDGFDFILISTFNLFNPKMSVSFSLKRNKEDKIESRQINKLSSSINLASFLCNRIVIFSKKEIPLLSSVLGNMEKRIDNVEYLEQKTIKKFFDSLTPIRRSKSMKNFYLAASFVFCAVFFFASSVFEEEGAIQQTYDNKFSSIETQIKRISKEQKKLLGQQESLFMKTSNNLKVFIPNNVRANNDYK